jgi:hypothetical protein
VVRGGQWWCYQQVPDTVVTESIFFKSVLKLLL